MSESDQKTPAVAPAPPPPPGAKPPQRGFDTSAKRTGIEIIALVGLIVGAGVGAFMAAGALAAWLTPVIPMSVDETIGKASNQSMATNVCSDPEAERYVRELAAPLLEEAQPLPFEFSFRVADDPTINAYALPGGYVTVNRGLLEAAESGEEVAGVLGHEIQHALLRHGTRRVLRQLGGAMILSLLFGGTDIHGLTEVSGRLTSLSYDREQEIEADVQGVELMVAAGIDPRGLSRFFDRLRKDAGPTPPELLSTHPEPQRRADLVESAAAGESFRTLPPPPKNICHGSSPEQPADDPAGVAASPDEPEGSY